MVSIRCCNHSCTPRQFYEHCQELSIHRILACDLMTVHNIIKC